jgi:hypothetical protein
MKQFKALLRKEWQTHRFTFLIPSYVVTAFFVFSGLISIYGAIRYGMPDFISIGDTSRIDPDLVIRGMLYSMSVVLGWFCILSSMQSNENMLNGDYVKNCEIMHNSQPVKYIEDDGGKADAFHSYDDDPICPAGCDQRSDNRREYSALSAFTVLVPAFRLS